MANYYGNAFFTIGATGAIDCNDGFLKSRPALEYPPNGSVKILYYSGTSDRREEMHLHPPQPLRAVCVDNPPPPPTGLVHPKASLLNAVSFLRPRLPHLGMCRV